MAERQKLGGRKRQRIVWAGNWNAVSLAKRMQTMGCGKRKIRTFQPVMWCRTYIPHNTINLPRQITQIKQRKFSVLHHVLLSDHTMQQRTTTALHFPMLCLYPTLFLSDIRTSSHCLVNPWPRESVQGIIRPDQKQRPSSELIIYDLRKDVLP